MSLQCLITGCELFDHGSGRSLHGDLHALESVYIFNGVLNDDVEAKWEYKSEPPDASKRTLLINSGTHFFERRGVIVVSTKDANLNVAALNYLGGR